MKNATVLSRIERAKEAPMNTVLEEGMKQRCGRSEAAVPGHRVGRGF